MLTFQKARPQVRRAKVLLLGEAGTGKSHAALTFPAPVVIDAEGSIDWFADRFDFKAVATKSYADVRDLVRQVREGNVECETLVIDSLTTIYNGLVNVASREREDLRPLDWGRIKRKFSSLLDELYHQLPMHVVCVGWISTEYARAGTTHNGQQVKPNDLIAIGEKFDGDKKTMHAFDFCFKILGNDGKKTRALVLKSRSGQLKNGQIIEDFSWKTLQPLLPNMGDAHRGMTDDEQLARDANVLEDLPPSNGKAAASGPRKAYTEWLARDGRPDTAANEAAFRVWAKGLTPTQVLARLAEEREATPAAVAPPSADAPPRHQPPHQVAIDRPFEAQLVRIRGRFTERKARLRAMFPAANSHVEARHMFATATLDGDPAKASSESWSLPEYRRVDAALDRVPLDSATPDLVPVPPSEEDSR